MTSADSGSKCVLPGIAADETASDPVAGGRLPYPLSFPRHYWYPAARSAEVTTQPLGRRVLGVDLCLWRADNGGGPVVGMEDRCPHRNLPLSMGTVVDQSLQCQYHGLRFAAAGRCVRVPSQARVPAKCSVHTYPVVEQERIVWVWLAEEPPTSSPPAIPGDTGQRCSVVEGTLHANCRAQLMNENLLDLSHASFLHSESIGTEEIAATKPTTTHTHDSVKVVRFMKDTRVAPIHARLLQLDCRVARSQSAEWIAPVLHVTTIENTTDEGQNFRHRVVSCITPESDSSIHYLWLVLREYLHDSAEADRIWAEGLPAVIQQDIDATEAIERRLAVVPDLDEVNIAFDAGPLHSRRIVQRMIKEEQVRSEGSLLGG